MKMRCMYKCFLFIVCLHILILAKFYVDDIMKVEKPNNSMQMVHESEMISPLFMDIPKVENVSFSSSNTRVMINTMTHQGRKYDIFSTYENTFFVIRVE